MKFTWLHFLGYLGFLGLLGFIESGFFGFFGFFAFLGAFRNLRHDELLDANVNKACRNVYVSSFITIVIAIICIPFLEVNTILLFAFILIFVIHVVVFWLSLIYYERIA